MRTSAPHFRNDKVVELLVCCGTLMEGSQENEELLNSRQYERAGFTKGADRNFLG